MKTPRPTASHKRHSQGLSLIELMVAMVIGMLIVGGVLYLFQGSRQTFRQGDAMARVQENGRIAIDILGDAVRLAGYAGCRNLSQISLAGTSFTNSNVIAGRSAAASGDALAGNNGKAGSSVLTVTYLSGGATFLTQDMDPTAPDTLQLPATSAGQFAAGSTGFITNCERSEAFQVADFSADASGATLETSLPLTTTFAASNTLLGRVVEQSFYVARTGRTDARGQPIFALFRQATVSGASVGATPEEIADGVEDMRITYGLDTSGDLSVNEYTSTLTATNAPQVTSVRIELLVASTEGNTLDAPQPYVFAGTTTTPTDRVLRTSIGTTLTLRNRIR